MGLWKRTDEDEKEFARQDLAELTRKADDGLIDLVYFDGSGFNLWAKVVYAWQKRGERIVLPVSRGKSQSVLGFMWHKCQRFESFVFEEAVDSNVVIGCFEVIAPKVFDAKRWWSSIMLRFIAVKSLKKKLKNGKSLV